MNRASVRSGVVDNMASINARSDLILDSKMVVLVSIPFPLFVPTQAFQFVRFEILAIIIHFADLTSVTNKPILPHNLQQSKAELLVQAG